MSICNRFRLKLRKEDVKKLGHVWPVPDHSHKSLKLIFPNMTKADDRAAIRLLQKSMHKPPDVVTMVALLCFWTADKFDWNEWQ